MYALSKAYLCYYVFANANKQLEYDLSIDISHESRMTLEYCRFAEYAPR